MTGRPAPRSLGALKRKSVSDMSGSWVREERLEGGGDLPLVLRPAIEGLDLSDWAAGNRERIEGWLRRHGGILFRGFGLTEVAQLERFITGVSKEWAQYREAATPRSALSERIFTSTDYPPHETIYLHNENSHCESWPLKIFFLCLVPAQQGGETPVADCRQVYRRLPADLRGRFVAKKILYVRNFGDGLGLPWQTVFKTEDPAEVESYCRQAGIAVEWKEGGRLRTRYVREAVARHPVTGEEIWFNHGTFFHVSTLSPAVREALLSQVGEEDLPYNTYYGDGSPIELEALDALREAYAAETVAFPWQAGDLMMLDNMLVAHGRQPFMGPRRIAVGMSEPVDL